jgi:hypothetical protein
VTTRAARVYRVSAAVVLVVAVWVLAVRLPFGGESLFDVVMFLFMLPGFIPLSPFWLLTGVMHGGRCPRRRSSSRPC